MRMVSVLYAAATQHLFSGSKNQALWADCAEVGELLHSGGGHYVEAVNTSQMITLVDLYGAETLA